MIFEMVSQLRICRIGVTDHVRFICIDVLWYSIVALETNRKKCEGSLRPSEIACSFVYSCVIAGQ
jgi:hypothetical protein